MIEFVHRRADELGIPVGLPVPVTARDKPAADAILCAMKRNLDDGLHPMAGTTRFHWGLPAASFKHCWSQASRVLQASPLHPTPQKNSSSH
jgi:hypothetical protein